MGYVVHGKAAALPWRPHERGRLDERRVGRDRAVGPPVGGHRPGMQPDLVGYGDERQLDQLAEQPQQHLVAGRPPHPGLLSHGGIEEPGRDPALGADHRLEHLVPQRRRHQHEARLGDADREDVAGRPVDLEVLTARPIPVLAELLPRARHRPHAHAVHPVPLDVFVEQLPPLRVGEAAAEVLGRLDDEHEERGVRPVERVRIERVVAAARRVDALDRGVVALDLRAGLGGSLTVVDHAHDRVHGAGDPLQRFLQQDRMVFHTRAECGVHVLDRADPHAEHAGADVAEVLPRQRVRTQRVRCRGALRHRR